MIPNLTSMFFSDGLGNNHQQAMEPVKNENNFVAWLDDGFMIYNRMIVLFWQSNTWNSITMLRIGWFMNIGCALPKAWFTVGKWILFSCTLYTPENKRLEPENDGFQEESPVPVVYFQVCYSKFRGGRWFLCFHVLIGRLWNRGVVDRPQNGRDF